MQVSPAGVGAQLRRSARNLVSNCYRLCNAASRPQWRLQSHAVPYAIPTRTTPARPPPRRAQRPAAPVASPRRTSPSSTTDPPGRASRSTTTSSQMPIFTQPPLRAGPPTTRISFPPAPPPRRRQPLTPAQRRLRPSATPRLPSPVHGAGASPSSTTRLLQCLTPRQPANSPHPGPRGPTLPPSTTCTNPPRPHNRRSRPSTVSPKLMTSQASSHPAPPPHSALAPVRERVP